MGQGPLLPARFLVLGQLRSVGRDLAKRGAPVPRQALPVTCHSLTKGWAGPSTIWGLLCSLPPLPVPERSRLVPVPTHSRSTPPCHLRSPRAGTVSQREVLKVQENALSTSPAPSSRGRFIKYFLNVNHLCLLLFVSWYLLATYLNGALSCWSRTPGPGESL